MPCVRLILIFIHLHICLVLHVLVQANNTLLWTHKQSYMEEDIGALETD